MTANNQIAWNTHSNSFLSSIKEEEQLLQEESRERVIERLAKGILESLDVEMPRVAIDQKFVGAALREEDDDKAALIVARLFLDGNSRIWFKLDTVNYEEASKWIETLLSCREEDSGVSEYYRGAKKAADPCYTRFGIEIYDIAIPYKENGELKNYDLGYFVKDSKGRTEAFHYRRDPKKMVRRAVVGWRAER